MEQEVMRPRIGAQEVLRAAEILRKYRRGKENLDKRIIDNEQFWKLRHWEQMEKAGEGGNPADPRPASGWLVNCILSKHADAMDSYPEPTVLPREPDDREEAAKLTRILPVILKNNRFKREYAKAWWNKLKSGCAVYGVFWDGDKLHGLGDVDIRSMDVLNLFWEPGVQDIQASEHFFSTELVPDHRLLREYPQLEGKLGRGGGAQVSRYLYDDRVDTSDRSLVVDWYYHTEVNGQPVLQYCKFVGETVLYADSLAQTLFHKKNCGISLPTVMEERTLSRVSEQSAALFRICEDLQTALHNAPAADGGIDVARWYRAEIAARTQQAGELVNQLETIVDAACWPYPTYADILFSV